MFPREKEGTRLTVRLSDASMQQLREIHKSMMPWDRLSDAIRKAISLAWSELYPEGGPMFVTPPAEEGGLSKEAVAIANKTAAKKTPVRKARKEKQPCFPKK